MKTFVWLLFRGKLQHSLLDQRVLWLINGYQFLCLFLRNKTCFCSFDVKYQLLMNFSKTCFALQRVCKCQKCPRVYTKRTEREAMAAIKEIFFMNTRGSSLSPSCYGLAMCGHCSRLHVTETHWKGFYTDSIKHSYE